MTELLVATKKGLFVLEGEPDGPFAVSARAFAGEPVEYAVRDPATGRILASVTSPFYGPKIWWTDLAPADWGAKPASTEFPPPEAVPGWTQADGVSLPAGGDQALERIWVIKPGEDGVLYAGGDPGVLFESRDGGATWKLNEGLWNEPSRPDWQPGGGGLCLHSIVPWPGEPDKLAVAISAAGMWLTDDGGASWRRSNEGLTVDYEPDDAEAPALCVHHVERSPADPERLFMQFHGGVYRSDDAGESWIDIGNDLPSDFGFPLAVDPEDADRAFVIPLVGGEDRVTPDARVRVYETSDAGASWTARGEGLPQQDAYLTVLRLAFDRTGRELYFGATSGDLFGSADNGVTWFAAATRLPPVHAVSAG